tara:strand:- start:525 stop:788 length:264 start_codon:yes stop_codon:yes gene_type:complete
MANHASARKRIRRNNKRAIINSMRKSRIRTFVKKVELAIEQNDAKAAEAAYKAAKPEMMRGVSKGVFEKKAVSRKLSRLSGRIKALK